MKVEFIIDSMDEPTERDKCVGILRGCLAMQPPDAINFLLGGCVLLSQNGEALGSYPLEDLIAATGKA